MIFGIKFLYIYRFYVSDEEFVVYKGNVKVLIYWFKVEMIYDI